MKYYFLFGEIICNCYLNANDFKDVIDKIKEGHCDWSIFCYDDKADHPSELISASIGWIEFAQITGQEYDLLLPIQLSEREK